MTDLLGPQALFELSCAHVAARALHVVADLGTADAIDAEPRTADDLGRAGGADPDVLDRLLRLLETHGLFTCDRDGRWGHTDMSRLLRSDHPTSLRAFARMTGLPFCWGAFTALDHTVRTGEPAMLAVDPAGLWPYLDRHPDEYAIFNEAMTGKAHGDVAATLAAYDFSRHRRVADIGGGHGHLITAVLAAAPATSGVLFDLPQVASVVTPVPRLEVVAGDFFTDPLPRCDAYVLMQVVHDWDDKDTAAILTAVAQAGRHAHATVLLIEMVMPDGPEAHGAKTLDVMMLAVTGGRERTRAGYEALLDGAGLDLVTVIPTGSQMSIIECRVR